MKIASDERITKGAQLLPSPTFQWYIQAVEYLKYQYRVNSNDRGYFVEKYDFTSWQRITSYYNVRPKAEQIFDGLTTQTKRSD